MNKAKRFCGRFLILFLFALGMTMVSTQNIEAKSVYSYTEIVLGTTIEQGNIPGYSSYYRQGDVMVQFVVETNGCVEFRPQNGKKCEYYLFDGQKKLIGKTTQTGPLSMYLTAGTYYCNLSCSATGRYDYIDTSFTPSEKSDNTTFANAVTITGTTYQGFNYAKSENYYSFSVPYDCEATIEIVSDKGFYGNLYGSNKKKLQTLFDGVKQTEPGNVGSEPLLIYIKQDFATTSSGLVLGAGSYYIGLSGMGEFQLNITIGNKITSSNTKLGATPYVYAQTYSGLIYAPTLSQSKNEVLIQMVGTDIADSYEIYRSTKKDSGYKRIKTIKNNANYTNYNYISDQVYKASYPVRHEYIDGKDYYVYHFNDKNLSANKAYYYKVKLTKKTNGVALCSKLSSAKAYWTTPKKVTIRVSESYTKATWKKVSGASGYLVREKFIYFRGYNIFGKRLYGTNDRVTRTTKTSYTKIAGSWGLKEKKDVTVIPYVKHGKYYYVNGYHVISEKEMKTLTMDLQDTSTYSILFGK